MALATADAIFVMVVLINDKRNNFVCLLLNLY